MESPLLLCLTQTQAHRCVDITFRSCIDGGVWAVAGLVMAVFFRNAAPPLYFMGGFTTLTRIIIACIDACDQSILYRIKQVVSKFQKDYAGITIAGALLACAVCTILPTAGMVLGACVGVLHGIHRSVQSVAQDQQSPE